MTTTSPTPKSDPTPDRPAQVTASDIARMMEVNGVDAAEVAYQVWVRRVSRIVASKFGVPLECGEDVDTRAMYECYPDPHDAATEVGYQWGIGDDDFDDDEPDDGSWIFRVLDRV